jgi:hypothetical protein
MAKYVVILGNGFFDLYRAVGTFDSEIEANDFADTQNSDSTIVQLIDNPNN